MSRRRRGSGASPRATPRSGSTPNQDGWPDLYVANDFETPDRFYMNNGDGTFTDVVDERLPHVTYFSMGADSGDLNNDGLIDFMVTDMRDRTHAGS